MVLLSQGHAELGQIVQQEVRCYQGTQYLFYFFYLPFLYSSARVRKGESRKPSIGRITSATYVYT